MDATTMWVAGLAICRGETTLGSIRFSAGSMIGERLVALEVYGGSILSLIFTLFSCVFIRKPSINPMPSRAIASSASGFCLFNTQLDVTQPGQCLFAFK